MQLPPALIQSLQGLPGFNEEAFLTTHNNREQITSIRINPAKIKESGILKFDDDQIEKIPVPWCSNGWYLSSRPSFTFDPLFHAGTYYVQEASSMFLEQALKQTLPLNVDLKVLDLCAAPGGKSTHIQSLLTGNSLLVSNEVIKARAAILKENTIKWGTQNVLVSNNDPKDFAKLEGYFDAIIVDAPCSGSGLFRRDEDAIAEWSENNVILCSQRQQRILADVLPALKEGGVLIYSTCSYSLAEDEAILEWLCKEFDLESLPIELKPDWNIISVQSNKKIGYRFWPHLAKGEGFFLGAFRKISGKTRMPKNKTVSKPLSKKELDPLFRWVQTEGQQFVNFGANIYAWPENLYEQFDILAQQLKIIYSGTMVGELMKNKLVPNHSLALSTILSPNIKKTELVLPSAIQYLQRRDFELPETTTGWQLAAYKGFPVGWMNVLPNRVNNYYPKELRILKDRIV